MLSAIILADAVVDQGTQICMTPFFGIHRKMEHPHLCSHGQIRLPDRHIFFRIVLSFLQMQQ